MYGRIIVSQLWRLLLLRGPLGVRGRVSFVFLPKGGGDEPAVAGEFWKGVSRCFILLTHWARRAASRAAWTAGKSRAISTEMIAITTSNSISVKPGRHRRRVVRAVEDAGTGGGERAIGNSSIERDQSSG